MGFRTVELCSIAARAIFQIGFMPPHHELIDRDIAAMSEEVDERRFGPFEIGPFVNLSFDTFFFSAPSGQVIGRWLGGHMYRSYYAVMSPWTCSEDIPSHAVGGLYYTPRVCNWPWASAR